jgi:hypothetical protein
MIFANSGQNHMIMTSSHKTTQDSRDYIDFKTLKTYKIFINNISNVCVNHLHVCLTNNINFCICNLFQKPFHIKYGSEYARITKAFSLNKKDTSLLSESGIDFNPKELSEETKPARALGNTDALRIFLCDVFDTRNHIRNFLMDVNSTPFRVSRKVSVYIDPAPTRVGSSLNAISCVTKVTNVNNNKIFFVILCVEEFCLENSTGSYGGFSEIGRRLVAISDILSIIYDEYFNTYYVAIEANSLDANESYSSAVTEYLNKKRSYITYFTIIKSGKKRKIANFKNHHHHHHHDDNSFRIGYCLGKEKNQYILDFFNNVFCGNIKTSKNLWSQSLYEKYVSLPAYIGYKLLNLRYLKNNKITGKRKRHSKNSMFYCTDDCTEQEYETDDLPISVIMSTMLYDLLILENKFTFVSINYDVFLSSV